MPRSDGNRRPPPERASPEAQEGRGAGGNRPKHASNFFRKLDEKD